VGLNGVEPLTSRLSGVRSNQLSYRPNLFYPELTLDKKMKIVKNYFKRTIDLPAFGGTQITNCAYRPNLFYPELTLDKKMKNCKELF
jgi:hypothetical protein